MVTPKITGRFNTAPASTLEMLTLMATFHALIAEIRSVGIETGMTSCLGVNCFGNLWMIMRHFELLWLTTKRFRVMLIEPEADSSAGRSSCL